MATLKNSFDFKSNPWYFQYIHGTASTTLGLVKSYSALLGMFAMEPLGALSRPMEHYGALLCLLELSHCTPRRDHEAL